VFASSRLATSKFKRQLSCSAGVCFAFLSLSAASALADTSAPEGCAAQSFSQPFTAFHDFNYYKLVHGGEFNGPFEGWVLKGGAHIIQTTRPDGTTGGVLDMPAGSRAIAPPVGVTLQDRTARVWVRDVKGAEGVDAKVAYPYTNSWQYPQSVGHVHGQHTSWTLSTPFNVQPQIAGSKEGLRIVRFVFDASATDETQLFALWVDPRMREESALACGAGSETVVRGGIPGESSEAGVG
jgi:hypothetical protein